MALLFVKCQQVCLLIVIECEKIKKEPSKGEPIMGEDKMEHKFIITYY